MEAVPVRINAAPLLALKAARAGRKNIPVSEVVDEMNNLAKASGRKLVSRSAIDAWLAGNVTRLDTHIIAAWCEFLPCTIDQLIEVINPGKEEEKPGPLLEARAG
jgi:DNA-binding Xre family transcriptional regulator